jgi:hypothetical protein
MFQIVSKVRNILLNNKVFFGLYPFFNIFAGRAYNMKGKICNHLNFCSK